MFLEQVAALVKCPVWASGPSLATSPVQVVDGSRSAAGRPLSTGELIDMQKDINSLYEACGGTLANPYTASRMDSLLWLYG